MPQLSPIDEAPATSPEQPEHAWVDYIRSRVEMDWRPSEFDPDTLLYVPDVSRDDTYLRQCAKFGCEVRIQAKLCPVCHQERARLTAEHGQDFDLERWLAIPRKREKKATSCLVVDCQRNVATSGLCASHRGAHGAWKLRTGLSTVDDWVRDRNPRPFPPATQACRALICGRDAAGAHRLCDTHEGSWRQWMKKQGLSKARLDTVDDWLNNYFELPLAAGQIRSYAELGATPFHLLNGPIRWELLFAVQRRDLDGANVMLPLLIRRAYQALRRTEHSSLVGLEALGLPTPHGNVAGFFRDLQSRIDEAHRQWVGEDGREPGVYFLTDLDLAPSLKTVHRRSKIDLRGLKVSWWAESVDSYLLEGGQHGRNGLEVAVRVAEIVDSVLHQRGTPTKALGRADMDAIVRAFRKRWTATASQRKALGALRSMLDFFRLSDDFLPVWNRIPSGFDVDRARHKPAGTPTGGKENDDAFRFVPQPIVDWLMDHIHLVRRNTPLQTMEAKMMIYVHERCGRRTAETVRLKNDCLAYDSAGQAYLKWDRAKPPYGAGTRLPIHQDVHDAIREWQAIKAEYGIESEWLFPSDRFRTDTPRSTAFFRDRISELLEAVLLHAPYESEVEGADGNLVYFDLRTIDAYSFRHAFAQRHADATDGSGRPTFTPEDLQEWMGHKTFDTTMGYFVITSRRKRHVMAALPSRRLNFLGNPVPIDRERDAFTKLAVSLGSCTEPVNVAAGGNACALDHACESCPFFLVDPFERDGLAAKRLYLQAQIERVRIIAPDSHMIQHYELRVADCDRIIAGIDTYVDGLPAADKTLIRNALDQMAEIRRRATAPRRINLREILRGTDE